MVKDFQKYWKEDLIAGLSVALVALPLALSIAIAAGAPPISGIISSIVGGVLTTFLRQNNLGINGPGNGLIVVVLSGLAILGDFQTFLAASFVAGLVQILLGILRLGRFSDFFPATVVQGLLAAIGVIILAKQVHVALGVQTSAKSIMDIIIDIPNSIVILNPFVVIISIFSIGIMYAHRFIKISFIKFIPSVVWVILFSIPFYFLYQLDTANTMNFFGMSFEMGQKMLIQGLPESFSIDFALPNFSRITEPGFWQVVFLIVFIGSIETLISSKAVEKLDPEKRQTNKNLDLISVGASTAFSSLIGGLPVITVIVRSSVNINHGAKSRFSNFFHGSVLLLLVVFALPLIKLVPTAALAAILIFTGFKLTSPRKFKDVYRKGWEQLTIMLVSFIATLTLGLIYGVLVGMVFALYLHYTRSFLSVKTFLHYLRKPHTHLYEIKGEKYFFKIKGVCNFFNNNVLITELEKIPDGQKIVLDFSHARLVDHTVMEYLHDFKEHYDQKGSIDLLGLSILKSSSDHPDALHFMLPKGEIKRLSPRQISLTNFAKEHGFAYNPSINWNAQMLKNFDVFKNKIVSFKKNEISGRFKDVDISFDVADVTYDEGALMASEIHHFTLMHISLPLRIPEFKLEKEEFFDRLLEFAIKKDIAIEEDKNFTKKFALTGPNESEVKAFFKGALLDFLNQSDQYHIESCGEDLLIYKYLRLAGTGEIEELIDYSQQLLKRIIITGEQWQNETPSLSTR